MLEHHEQRSSQTHDQGDGEEQQDAGQHGQCQPELTGLLPLILWQPVRQDRDEDDVVDPEDDLEDRERGKGDPRLGAGQEFHSIV